MVGLGQSRVDGGSREKTNEAGGAKFSSAGCFVGVGARSRPEGAVTVQNAFEKVRFMFVWSC